jgi:hypothetical protein
MIPRRRNGYGGQAGATGREWFGQDTSFAIGIRMLHGFWHFWHFLIFFSIRLTMVVTAFPTVVYATD